MSPPSCSWCKDLSDLTGERKFQLHLASERRTHSGEGEDCVLMMVEAVSVGPGLNMEGRRTQDKICKKDSVQGKMPSEPGSCAAQEQWLIALAFLYWM